MSNAISEELSNSLRQVTLKNKFGGDFDITGMVQSLEIVEDWMHPALTGYMLIIDTTDLLSTMGINGVVPLEISFSDTIAGKIRTLSNLSAVEFEEIKRDTNNASNVMVAYKIAFCSKELFDDNSVIISRALHAPNITTSDIIREMIRRELHSTKPIDIEKTSSVLQNYIANTMTPFEVCYAMSPLSFSTTNPLGSLYFFYETINGYRFKSLETLTGPTQIENAIRYKSGTTGHEQDDYRAFKSLEFTNIRNDIRTILSTAAGSEVEVLDIKSKNIDVKVHDPSKDGPSTLPDSDSTKSISAGLSAIHKSLVIADGNSQAVAKGRRKATIDTLLAGVSAAGTMPQTFDIEVGSIIDVYMPKSGEETDGDSGLDTHMYTGPFLVTSVLHRFGTTPATSVNMIKNIFNLDPTAAYKKSGDIV